MSYRENPKTGKPRDSMLTEYQREFLRSDKTGYSDQNRYDYREAIKDRIWNTFQDFALLVEELPDEQRREIFDVERGLSEDQELQEGLLATIEFIYMGLGGPPAFEEILTWAVGNGEYELGNVEFAARVNVDFEVDYSHPIDSEKRKTIESIREGKTGQLSPFELVAFVESVRTELDFDELLERYDGGESWEDVSFDNLIEDNESN